MEVQFREKDPFNCWIWINFADVPSEGQKNYIFGKDGVASEAKKQNLNLLGEIPILTKISESGDTGKPLTFDQKSEVFKIFEKIGEKTVDASNKVKIKNVDISS